MVPKHRWALGGWPAGLQGQHSPRRPDAGRLLPRLCVLEGGVGSHSSLRSHTGCDQGAVGVRGPRSLDGHPAVTCRPHPLSTGVRPRPPPGPSLPVSAPGPAGKCPALPPTPQPLPGMLCAQFTLRAGPCLPGAAPPSWAQLPGTLWAEAAAPKRALASGDATWICQEFWSKRPSRLLSSAQPAACRPPGAAGQYLHLQEQVVCCEGRSRRQAGRVPLETQS